MAEHRDGLIDEVRTNLNAITGQPLPESLRGITVSRLTERNSHPVRALIGLTAATLAVAVAVVAVLAAHPASAPRPAVTATPNSNPYAGWKTYTSSYEGSSFMYPANWTLAAAPEPVSNGGVFDGNVLTLTSPSGFKVHFEAPSQNQGGGCPNDVTVEQVTPMSARAQAPLYLALVDNAGAMDFGVYDTVPSAKALLGDSAAAPYAGATAPYAGEQLCGFAPSFAGRSSHPAPLTLGDFRDMGFYSSNSYKMSVPAFLAMPDVQTAELIFLSLRY